MKCNFFLEILTVVDADTAQNVHFLQLVLFFNNLSYKNKARLTIFQTVQNNSNSLINLLIYLFLPVRGSAE